MVDSNTFRRTSPLCPPSRPLLLSPLAVAFLLSGGSGLVSGPPAISAFVVPATPSAAASAALGSGSALSAKQRGRLNKVLLDDDEQTIKVVTNKEKQRLSGGGGGKNKKGGKKKNAKDRGGGAAISPLLSEWAKGGDDGGSGRALSTKGVSRPAAKVFASFESDDDEKITPSRRKKGGKVKTRDDAPNSALIGSLLTDVETMLETTNCDVTELLSKLRSLADAQDARLVSPALKGLISAKAGDPSYRLAWVGGDKGICHIGTGLHKVPLARLQEIFITLRGWKKIELLEVIRILGPFPNVRNTLRGEVRSEKGYASTAGSEGDGKGRQVAELEIRYDSMIDGTGKEILAGKEKNVRDVSLDVWFADEKALVCTVPADGDDDGDPFSGNGARVLLFVAEEDLEKKLDKLRAS